MIALLAIVLGLFGLVQAGESHTVTFTNKCGHGIPKLMQGGNILSTGEPYTSNGPLLPSTAYLDNGSCDRDGSYCTEVELALRNGEMGSNAGLSLIPPLHVFSDAAGFQFTDGCPGAFCAEAGCKTAAAVDRDLCVQVACGTDNVGINIIFCGGPTHFTDPSQKGLPCT